MRLCRCSGLVQPLKIFQAPSLSGGAGYYSLYVEQFSLFGSVFIEGSHVKFLPSFPLVPLI